MVADKISTNDIQSIGKYGTLEVTGKAERV